VIGVNKNNIEHYRKEAGLTLQELADAYGGVKSHIWSLEKGHSMPTLITAYKIAKVLDEIVYQIWPDETEIVEETITVRRIKK
jgi:DNA-binding XRE family transcriptional regulator